MKLITLFLMLFSPLYALTGLPISLQNLTLAGPNANIQLAVAPNGQAIAVWTNFPNQVELQGAYYLVGNGWFPLNNTPFDPILQPDVANYFFQVVQGDTTFALGSAPRVAIDQNGLATVVWVTPNNQIAAARYMGGTFEGVSGGILTNVTQLTTTGTVNISPTIAASLSGITVVVWIQSVSYQVLARSFNPAPGGGWGNTVTFMPIPANNCGIPVNVFGTYPAVFAINDVPPLPAGTCLSTPTITGTGTGTMVWIDGPTGTVRTGNFAIP